jgi:hypothetical protein
VVAVLAVSGAALATAPHPLDSNSLLPIFASTTAKYMTIDPILIIRGQSSSFAGAFDALAPYSSTAVGIFTRIERRPAEEATLRNKNTAIAYAAARILVSIFGDLKTPVHKALTDMGLDPLDLSEDLATPIGIGNFVGRTIAAYRRTDGLNQEGDLPAVTYFRARFQDYQRYRPLNSAYELRYPSRWQPDRRNNKEGVFTVQEHVFANLRTTKGLAVPDISRIGCSRPKDSDFENNLSGYRRQAREVLEAVAGLDDQHKMYAEYFDNKVLSLRDVGVLLFSSRSLTLDQWVQEQTAEWSGMFDGARVIWRDKIRYDAVRPFSAIRRLWGNADIQSWGGPGKGVVTMKGREWSSYLGTPPHTEYPSGSTCFCVALAQTRRRFFAGSDVMELSVPRAKGSSVVEPGVTPAADTVMYFSTLTQFETECGQSRVYGGVHFQYAITEAARVCRDVSNTAFDWLRGYVEGFGTKISH